MLQFRQRNTSARWLSENNVLRCTLSVVRVEYSWGPLVAGELTCSFRSADPGKPRPENKVWLSMVCARSHSWCRHPRNPAGIVHTYQHDRAKHGVTQNNYRRWRLIRHCKSSPTGYTKLTSIWLLYAAVALGLMVRLHWSNAKPKKERYFYVSRILCQCKQTLSIANSARTTLQKVRITSPTLVPLTESEKISKKTPKTSKKIFTFASAYLGVNVPLNSIILKLLFAALRFGIKIMRSQIANIFK